MTPTLQLTKRQSKNGTARRPLPRPVDRSPRLTRQQGAQECEKFNANPRKGRTK